MDGVKQLVKLALLVRQLAFVFKSDYECEFGCRLRIRASCAGNLTNFKFKW